MHVAVPRALADACERSGRQDWLASLPSRVAAVAEDWELEVGEPYQPGGQTAWVAPVRRGAAEELVLKVMWPHFEADHEADGLRAWNGDGAVLLHAAEERDGCVALLLERCTPGSTLAARPEVEQDIVIATLLRRLWRAPEPGHPFRSLQTMCDAWVDEFDPRASGVDPGLVRVGLALFRSLPGTADRNVLLSTDLHAGNVLAARREPWLMIDPKPFVGDPTYDAVQHLVNRADRLVVDSHGLIERMAQLLQLDPGRLRLWTFARCVVESDDWPELAALAPHLAPT